MDGPDNVATRSPLNDAAVLRRKLMVHGSLYSVRCQAMVRDPQHGSSPCHPCRFHSPPPPELGAKCAEAGAPGVPPRMIGMIQATEVIELVLGLASRWARAC